MAEWGSGRLFGPSNEDQLGQPLVYGVRRAGTDVGPNRTKQLMQHDSCNMTRAKKKEKKRKEKKKLAKVKE